MSLQRNKQNFQIFNTEKLESNLILENGFLQVVEYKPGLEVYPKYFRTDKFIVELLVKGEMHAQINLQDVHLKAPCVIAILPDFVLHVDFVSEDCETYEFVYDRRFVKDMQMTDYSFRILQTVRFMPYSSLTAEQLQISEQYFRLLQNVLRRQEDFKKRECLLKLTVSFFHYLQSCFSEYFDGMESISRSKQLTADFIDLVKKHYHEQKQIAWYANELCISTKYLIKIVKQTTGRTIKDWIDDYTILNAKILLSTSNLDIKQITDRIGFKNQSHFGTFFKSHEGVSPAGFRKKQ